MDNYINIFSLRTLARHFTALPMKNFKPAVPHWLQEVFPRFDYFKLPLLHLSYIPVYSHSNSVSKADSGHNYVI